MKPQSLVVALLVMAGVTLAPAVPRICETPIASASAQIVVSQDRPCARIEIPSSVLTEPSSFLEVEITHIVNTSKTPFSVYVSAIPRESGPDLADRKKLLLGSFSVYPPDQPGTFLLRVPEALQQMLALKPGSAKPCQFLVLLEIKPISGTAFPASVEVKIAPMRWLTHLEPAPSKNH